MVAITATLVKELRERTGSGMMECKKALQETQGDIEAAVEAMRKAGQAKADKKASRVAAEGLIVIRQTADAAAMVEVNCETDFVTKNDDFREFAAAVVEAVLDSDPADLEALLALTTANGRSIEQNRRECIAKIGENINVRRFARLTTPTGVLGSYLHGTRIGVLVELAGGDGDLARDIAMHVAASRPLCVSADQVPAEQVTKEKEIFAAQAATSGKPADIVEKMVEGRMQEVHRRDHAARPEFRQGPGSDRREAAQEQSGATVSRFVRYEVGEGIDKKEDDFRRRGDGSGPQAANPRAECRPPPTITVHGSQSTNSRGAMPMPDFRPTAYFIKLSGEALMGEGDYGIDPNVLARIGDEIHDLRQAGVEVAIVIGGGNIFRGAGLAASGVDRVTADQMGMLATVINALAIQDALERKGMYARVMSAIKINQVCEDYIRRRAVRHLEKGRVVVLAAGTGNPFFTTDSAASLRAIEINAELLIKATKVDGIYSADPFKDPKALRYDRLTYDEALARKLQVLDATAIVMCRENDIPLKVFNINRHGDLVRVVCGESVGTTVVRE
jgi:uridylate kinase/translation elongation factor Ts